MNKEQLRMIFMGTPDISAQVFQDMINDGYHFVALICQADKPVGRKKELKPVPTKIVALKNNIPVFQPLKIRLDYEFVKSLKPDIIITMAYGQIVPQGLLDIPPLGCLNLHASLLPHYRGAAPIQRAIMNNEKETGVTLMEMIDKMDAGRMYAKELISILEEDNYSTLRAKIAVAASKLILEKLPLYLDGKLQGTFQNEDDATFANKILSEDEHLSFDCSALEFVNKVRALSFEPGGYCFLDDKKLKILKAHIVNHSSGDELIGEIVDINKELIVKVSPGYVSLDILQLEGKNKTDARSFINGHQNILHKILK